MSDAILEPGWLMRTCHEAHIQAMMDNAPGMLIASGFKGTTPISGKEAAELFDMMDLRFRAWTGRSLAEQAERAKT